MIFTIYDLATGEIKYPAFIGEDVDTPEIPEGCGYVVGNFPKTQYRIVDREAVLRDPRPPDPPTPDQVLRQAVGQDAVVQQLIRATPTQIETWVDQNVQTLAGAQELFKRILKVLAVLARQM